MLDRRSAAGLGDSPVTATLPLIINLLLCILVNVLVVALIVIATDFIRMRWLSYRRVGSVGKLYWTDSSSFATNING